jgi:conjugative transfer signal peptidase TraF
MKLSRLAKRTALGAAGAFVLLAAVAYQAGVVFNTTPSLPKGIYRTVEAPIELGAYVKFCPPKSPVFDEARRRGYLGPGFCPGGYEYMLKQVLAAKGDRVEVAAEGVHVNGQLVPMSEQLLADGGGRLMPRYAQHRILFDNELLLMSEVSRVSFDARYFGPLDRAQVRAVVKPVFTW